MLLLSIIFLPLFGSIASGFFGFYLGRKGSIFITTFTTFLSFTFTCIVLHESMTQEYEYIVYLFTWINSGLFNCNWCFLFDSLTMIMLFVVTSVSTLVHLYSADYMSTDPHLERFMAFLSLFTFFMLMLITGDNFIHMFVGWEGVGFCSFLLINFWFTRLQANKAAIKAMLVNRISDLILILGILTIFYNIKTLDYFSTFAVISIVEHFTFLFCNYYVNIINTICTLIFIGAMGKSAQVGLHLWLPDAMEGPTPVSALIHAATMVTAGVYLITRCSPIFEYSVFSLKMITIVGATTAFMGSTIGLVQNDFKKIIAYSTCSQLGYMFIACGLSNYPLAMFHLSNHAYFKALLFLCSGVVIHAMGDEQDIRKMGGLRRILPFTYIMFLIGSLSLMGFPFLSGFYSKDLILEAAFGAFDIPGHFAYWLGTIGAFFTAFYSTRLIYFAFLSETNAYKNVIKNAHDVPLFMGIPLGILAFGSIFMGYLTKDMFVGMGTTFWNNSIFIHPYHNQMVDAEFLPTSIKLLPVILSFGGLLSAFYLYFYKFRMLFELKISPYGLLFYNFLNRKWYFDKIYYEFINQHFLQLGYTFTYRMIDKGLIEWFGPFGLVSTISFLSQRIISIQTGYIYHYSLLMFISSVFLIGTVLFLVISPFNVSIFYLFFFFLLILIFNKKLDELDLK